MGALIPFQGGKGVYKIGPRTLSPVRRILLLGLATSCWGLHLGWTSELAQCVWKSSPSRVGPDVLKQEKGLCHCLDYPPYLD